MEPTAAIALLASAVGALFLALSGLAGKVMLAQRDLLDRREKQVEASTTALAANTDVLKDLTEAMKEQASDHDRIDAAHAEMLAQLRALNAGVEKLTAAIERLNRQRQPKP